MINDKTDFLTESNEDSLYADADLPCQTSSEFINPLISRTWEWSNWFPVKKDSSTLSSLSDSQSGTSHSQSSPRMCKPLWDGKSPWDGKCPRWLRDLSGALCCDGYKLSPGYDYLYEVTKCQICIVSNSSTHLHERKIWKSAADHVSVESLDNCKYGFCCDYPYYNHMISWSSPFVIEKNNNEEL